MGLLMNTANEVAEKVKDNFNDDENYLFALKNNDVKTGLFKLILSKLYYTMDSARSFILYFNEKGINEKEISNTLKGNFVLMPWNEVEDFVIDIKNNKANLAFSHLGKKLLYEVPFSGAMATKNKNMLENLVGKNFNRID